MAAVSEDPISLWLKLGALEKLEQVVLDGYGDQLYGKTSRIPQVNKFLRQVPIFQSKIDEIHSAVSRGSLREVQQLIDRKKLAFCRDHLGASPMHKAVLFAQRPVIDYLLDRFPSVVHARDHRGRTPLHYAAVLSDGGEIYKMLLDHGADLKATDVFGNRPEYYMHAQDEMDLQSLREGNDNGKQNKPVKIKHFQPMNGITTKDSGARSAKAAGSRTQIRELLSQGSVEALEELVLQGHGDRLLGESATNPAVRDFIHMVPVYMERIYEIHRAVVRGRLRDVQTLLDRKKLALARDPLGATPLHKAVLYGHQEVAQYVADNYPNSLDAKDVDGRTALHYASALKDNHEMYNMLISRSANPLVLDYRGKTAEYYLQFPEHIHIEQLQKQSQRANANYVANHANRIKAVTSPKRKSPYPVRLPLNAIGNIRPMNGIAKDEETTHNDSTEDSEPLKNGHATFKMPKKTLFKSQPLLPPPKLKRMEINSASIKRWVKEEDLEKLEGAVLEGFGEKVARQKTENAKLQKYIDDQVPVLVRKIEAIHLAVSNDDLSELQSHLSEADQMALAKDRFGMAPLHRAVLLARPEALRYLVDRFPETLNARDKEGRTALHYAAAMSREPGASNFFKMLLEAGADPRIRDNQGRSPEYYRTHHVPIPHKLNQPPRKQRSRSEPPPPHRNKKSTLPGISSNTSSLPQVTLDKITHWLQSGDVEHIREFVHDGYGQHLVGKTSWNEEVRSYLKALPAYLLSVGSAFAAVERGDLTGLHRQLGVGDEFLARAKNGDGDTLLHHAVRHDQPDVVAFFLDQRRHDYLLNTKDRNGRTPLHVAAQQKNQYLYNLLTSSGADPMILDQKGRSAEYYMNSTSVKPSVPLRQASPHNSTTPENESSGGEKSTPHPQDTPPSSKETDTTKEGKTPEEGERSEVNVTPAVSTAEDIDKALEEALKTPDERGDDVPEEGVKEEKKEDEKEVQTEEKQEEEEKEAEKKEEPPPPPPPNVASPPQNVIEEAGGSGGDRLNELIEVWIRERDLLRLEHVVIAGQGERLIGRHSDDRQVQEFLDLVPTYMARIRGVHEAVVRGSLGEVEGVLTRKRFALSRDHRGASPLHLAVLHAHRDILQYVVRNFPEALDGPDNEGRTPLHYAAVLRDGGDFYRTLLLAGADETVKDKAGRTPDYYLTHPGELSIRDLLEGYRIPEANGRRPSQVNIWQRPPTEDENGAIHDLFEDEEDEFDPFEDIRPGHTPDFSSDPTPDDPPEEGTKDDPQKGEEEAAERPSIYPILFDRQNKDSRYLAGVLGDALIRGLTQVARKRPRDPIAYLATYLYQYAARNTTSREKAESEAENNSSPRKEDNSNDEEENARPTGTSSSLAVVDEEEEDEDEFALEFEDHTKMKDEEGCTVLHFAAARPHPDGSFYRLLAQAEGLVGERDARYRTARDVALEAGQEENAAAADRFVLDALLQGRKVYLKGLLMDGYDRLLRVAAEGEEAGARGILREAEDFVRRREELHGHVRSSYLEGVARVVRGDPTLVCAKSHFGRCALHLAVLFQHAGVVAALVRHSPQAVHVADNLGRTPLHYAMAVEKVDKLAKILITAGALKTIKDVRMRPPSFFFVYKDEIQALYEEEKRLA